MMALQQEFDAYQDALPALLQSRLGEYVVIHGQELCRFFSSYEEALSWAYEHFGLEPFFVKQIESPGQTFCR